MNIPTKEECYALLEKYKAPISIVDHVTAVAKVGRQLAEAFVAKGQDVNVEAVEAACLLHDVLKCVDFNNYNNFNEEEQAFYQDLIEKFGKGHPEAAEKMLTEEGYPEIGLIVRSHGLESIGEANGPISTAQKIVFYADKRAKYATIPLEKRFSEWKKKYSEKDDSRDTEYWAEKEKLTIALEEDLFEQLDISPGDLK
jgi:putative nucleotidyltransferase with HDIG domain|tara:strand:- start:545 stop:1138 length:594 start_codon:yes stop_codon:yes gene_type:complete